MIRFPKIKYKRLLEHLRDLVIVILIGNLISFMFSLHFDNFWERVLLNSVYSASIGGALWKGNEFIGITLGKKIDIHLQPIRSLRWNLITMFIYSLVAIVVVNYIWFVVIFDWTAQRMFKNSMITMLIELFVTVAITSIFFSIGFFKAWRESAVNEERLQKEGIKLQYQALKNQVNPHFLFNSLNSLSSLVYQDQEQAVKFIKQLSEVYRYVLTQKDNELVRLEDEINFAKTYVYLQKIRLGDNLHVNFSMDGNAHDFVVPVSIQILIENAIKHNEASAENPLTIEIWNTNETVKVKNNLQPIRVIKDSGGIGLSTIKARYSFLSSKEVVTEETEDSYIVEIPLINQLKA